MMNQELLGPWNKISNVADYGICCRELGGSTFGVFVHTCAVSAQSPNVDGVMLEFLSLFSRLKNSSECST